MDEKLFNDIEAYLRKNTTDEQMVAFEKKMNTNPKLKKQVDLSRELSNHFNEKQETSTLIQNEYANELKDFLNSEDAIKIKQQLEEAKSKYKKKPLFHKNLIIGLAANIVLLMSIFFAFQYQKNISPQELYATYYNAKDLPSVASRDDVTSTIQEAVNAFQQEEYQTSMKLLNSLKNNEGATDVAPLLYRGVIYIQLEEYSQAITTFNKVISSNSLDATKGIWFKALAYLKEGNTTAAKNTLLELKEVDFNYAKAQQLLKEL